VTATLPETGRLARARARMTELRVDVLLCSVGPDLPYLVGYEAMPLERLTMLVVPRDGEATLVVPELERPRVEERPDFVIRAWGELEDPVAIVAALAGPARTAAIGDHTWARFVLALQDALPSTRFVSAGTVTGPLRAVKDPVELAALRDAARAVDDIARALRTRPFGGRSERAVHRELVELMLDAGHERANFAIVATGDHAASPHHEPTERVIVDGDLVLCDFGGTMRGYCSDITRMYSVGEPTAEVADAYEVLRAAQEAGVAAGRAGMAAEAVDAAARRVIARAGHGPHFVHRTGHGIGVEAHEDPYVVAGNTTELVVGNVYSVEPGIYVPGRFGMRLEDIVALAPDGPERLNRAPRDLAIVA
jgi:Xaa-Pro aminopeptidase